MGKLEKLFNYNKLIAFLGLIIFLAWLNAKILIFSIFFTPFFFSVRLLKLAIYSSLCIVSVAIILIVLSLAAQTVMFFKVISPLDFFFGTVWQPNLTIHNGQLVKLFGVLPLVFGTLVIAVFATIISAPIGVLSAVYLTYFSSKKQRSITKPVIEAMSGIPTVVYGYFALNFISPLMRSFGNYFSFDISTECALCASFVVGVMMIPVVISLVDDILHSVPKGLYYGGIALGSTTTEVIYRIIFPYALPGIFSVVLLSFSRAIGETMIVLMLAGVLANFTLDPLQSVTTITVQIVTLLTGDQTFSSKESLAAYALGLMIFVLTWFLNAIGIKMAKRYK